MTDCPICHASMEEGYIKVGCCGNNFHTLCLLNWIYTNPIYSCPLCRNEQNPIGNIYALIPTVEEPLLQQNRIRNWKKNVVKNVVQ